MATYGVAPEDDGGIDALLDSSPDRGVHTSAAAETALLLALVGLAASPFTLMQGTVLAISGSAFVLGLVGVVSTSNPYVAGRGLVPVSLVAALVALVLVGLRYVGVDTAFGDDLLPAIADLLAAVNARVGL